MEDRLRAMMVRVPSDMLVVLVLPAIVARVLRDNLGIVRLDVADDTRSDVGRWHRL